MKDLRIKYYKIFEFSNRKLTMPSSLAKCLKKMYLSKLFIQRFFKTACEIKLQTVELIWPYLIYISQASILFIVLLRCHLQFFRSKKLWRYWGLNLINNQCYDINEMISTLLSFLCFRLLFGSSGMLEYFLWMTKRGNIKSYRNRNRMITYR